MIQHPGWSPEIFRIGPIALRWYALMYVIGFYVGFKLFLSRIKKGYSPLTAEQVESYISHLILGMIIGARVFYVVFYNFEEYAQNPLDAFKVWQGGLSFHGALVGLLVATMIFIRKYSLNFFEVTDELAACGTLGLFFGRMGNFINAELYGRATDLPWGFIFPTDPSHTPRHPSQLYEGFGEGIFLFLVLFFTEKYMRARGTYRTGIIGAIFVGGYGVIRFLVEFTREPDRQLGYFFGWVTMGQMLCFLMIAAGFGLARHAFKKPPVDGKRRKR